MTKDDIEILFRTHYRKMLILANTMLHDEESAHDIVHDVFSSLLSGNVESVTDTFLMKGVRFACLKHIRSLNVRERIKRLYSLECSDIESDEWPDEEDVALIREVVDNELSDLTSRIVRLRFYGRKTYKEIATQLCVSEVTVYKHLSHALGVLRQKLNSYER